MIYQLRSHTRSEFHFEVQINEYTIQNSVVWKNEFFGWLSIGDSRSRKHFFCVAAMLLLYGMSLVNEVVVTLIIVMLHYGCTDPNVMQTIDEHCK